MTVRSLEVLISLFTAVLNHFPKCQNSLATQANVSACFFLFSKNQGEHIRDNSACRHFQQQFLVQSVGDRSRKAIVEEGRQTGFATS